MAKIQDLPESTRKIILWVIIIIIGLILISLYIRNVQGKIKGFNLEEFKKELNLPSLEKGLNNLPKIEIPKINK